MDVRFNRVKLEQAYNDYQNTQNLTDDRTRLTKNKNVNILQMTKSHVKKEQMKFKKRKVDNYHFIKKVDSKFKRATGVGLS